jgi:N-acetyl-alpha-D-muramate 1-phosphate uridylyltransferase
MQCVILAGGLATRLRPMTDTVPKSMVLVAGKPFLAYQLQLLKKSGICNVVLCVGHLHEQITSYFGDGNAFGVSISYSYETDRLLGTGGAIRNALSLLHDKFFVMYGDSYLPVDFRAVWQFSERFGKEPLMVVYRNRSSYDASNVVFRDGMVQLYDKQNRTAAMEYIDYGLLVLNTDLFMSMPEGQCLDLAGLLSSVAAEGRLGGYEVQKRFFEIGSRDGLRDFECYVRQHREAL